jgi:hypothetical protein
VVGELALFVALVDRWPARSRVPAWTVTLIGLAVSVAGNIGHVHGHDVLIRATAAVPPLAAASALAVGLGVLKRVVEHHHQSASAAGVAAPGPPAALASKATAEAGTGATPKATARATTRPARKATTKATGRGPDAATEATRKAIAEGHQAPSARALARDHHIGRDKATEIRTTVLAEANGHGQRPPI